MPLTGPQLQPIHSVLLSAFNRDDLRMLVKYSLDVDLDAIASDSLSRSAQLFKLLEWVNGQGQIPEFLRAARDSRPKNQGLSNLVEQVLAMDQPPLAGTPVLGSTQLTRDDMSSGQRLDDMQLLAYQAGMRSGRGGDLENLLPAGAQQIVASNPAPRFDDLFEIVYRPEDIYPAIFRGDPGRLIAPYHVPHIAGRKDVEDVQAELRSRLQFASPGGALLVLSRAGLGKTREVAEMARQLCAEGWAICVAKGESDALMNPTTEIPEGLRSRRLLFVVDDLHKRMGNVTQENRPYGDRLNAFLDALGRFLLPGEMYVIATARNEPQYQAQLGLQSNHPLWRRFALYPLPEFSQAGLVAVLVSLAMQAGVGLDPAEAEQMVADSDKRLRTIVENVQRCQWQHQSLTHATWKQAQGQSWAMLFQEARQRWPDVLHVYQSLYLIRSAGLPTRTDYVVKLGNFMAGADVRPAAENLVNMGLLGMHGDRLDAFGDEQLADSLRARDSRPADLEQHWDDIIKAFCAVAAARPEWVEDLHVLAYALLTTAHADRAQAVAEAAIGLVPTRAEGYYLRGLASYDIDNLAAAEADFAAAIRHGEDVNGLYHFWRGLSLYYLARDQEAVAALTAAIACNSQTADYFHWRALSYYELGQYSLADTDLTSAMAADTSGSPLYPYWRGRMRMEMDDYAGALADFNAAIERDEGVTAFLIYFRGQANYANQQFAAAEKDFRKAIELDPSDAQYYFGLGLAHYDLEQYTDAEADFAAAIEQSEVAQPALYYWRGTARFIQGKFDQAEADVTLAIEHSAAPEPLYYYRRARTRYFQGRYADAEQDFTVAIQYDKENTARFRFWRAMTRCNAGRFEEAETDLTAAIGMSSTPESEYYYWRGRARYESGKYEEANADLSAAIDLSGGQVPDYLFWRATARYDLAVDAGYDRAGLAGAEADFTTAIELTPQQDLIPALFFGRGMARYYQQRYAEAEADFTRALEPDADETALYYFRRGRARYRQGNLAGAADDFSSAIRRSAVIIPIYYYWRGMVCYDRQQYEGAESNLTVAIEHEPIEEPSFYFWRGMACYYQNRYVDAETDFTAALACSATPDPTLCYRRGRARAYQARFKDAEADFTAAIAASDDVDPSYYFWRGIVRMELTDYGGADEDFSILLEHNAAAVDPWVYYERGLARAELDRIAEAQADLTSAIDHGLQDVDVYCQRSWIALLQGHADQARADCEAAALRSPYTPNLCHAWGDCHLAEGNIPAAIDQFKAAFAAAPADNWHGFCWAFALVLADRLAEAEDTFAQSVERASAREARRMLRWAEIWTSRLTAQLPAQQQQVLMQVRQNLAARAGWPQVNLPAQNGTQHGN